MKAPIKNVWSNNADPSNVQISTERVDQGWEKLYIPKAEEFNYILQENSDAIQNIAQEICNVLSQAHISPQNRDTQQPPFPDKDKDTTKLFKAILAITNMQIPNGTIRMYAGHGWQDNVTLPGWYICNASNKDKTYMDLSGITRKVPDLSKKFIRGEDVKSIKNEGGSEFIGITQMPAHSHGITNLKTKKDGFHEHGDFFDKTTHTGQDCTAVYRGEAPAGGVLQLFGQGEPGCNDRGVVGMSLSDHQHNMTGFIDASGGGQEYWQPYYDVVYIIKISD